jgi:hypothetical protein
MKSTIYIRFCSAILFAFLCLASARAQTPTLPKVDSVPGHSSPFISAFNDSRGFGKDPFFPKSTRHVPRLTVNTNRIVEVGELPAGLLLNGLSGFKDNRLAVINNKTYATGEEAEVRVGHQLFRVKVVEIKDRSVIISVNGSPPRELTLRSGL